MQYRKEGPRSDILARHRQEFVLTTYVLPAVPENVASSSYNVLHLHTYRYYV